MADHLRAELVTDALGMAIAHRRPAPGLIWHSDQGSQFVSLAFGQKARAAGIAQSMGSRGDCFDNAVAESFFATLKKELINRRSSPRRPSSAPRPSTTSKSSTTANDATAPSDSDPRPTTRNYPHPSPKKSKPPNQPLSTKVGELQSSPSSI